MSQDTKPGGPAPCVGCGILSTAHPVVAVMKPEDVPDGVPISAAGAHGFVHVPCCNGCWADPAHRVRPIKGHFFKATDATAAIHHAGSNVLYGPPRMASQNQI